MPYENALSAYCRELRPRRARREEREHEAAGRELASPVVRTDDHVGSRRRVDGLEVVADLPEVLLDDDDVDAARGAPGGRDAVDRGFAVGVRPDRDLAGRRGERCRAGRSSGARRRAGDRRDSDGREPGGEGEQTPLVIHVVPPWCVRRSADEPVHADRPPDPVGRAFHRQTRRTSVKRVVTGMKRGGSVAWRMWESQGLQGLPRRKPQMAQRNDATCHMVLETSVEICYIALRCPPSAT